MKNIYVVRIKLKIYLVFLLFQMLGIPAFSIEETKTSSVNALDTNNSSSKRIFGFSSHGGVLRKNQHAVVFEMNGSIFPPIYSGAYQYGVLKGTVIGVFLGGSNHLLQSGLFLKQRLYETPNTQRFFWGIRLESSYYNHQASYTGALVYDDVSWRMKADHALSFRKIKERRYAFSILSCIIMDYDLRTPRRQMDWYVCPINIGWEVILSEFSSFNLELGATLNLTGTETNKGLFYYNAVWPLLKLGVSFRFPSD